MCSVQVKSCECATLIAQEVLGMGPCAGELFVLRNSHQPYPSATVRCERHARMVEAWAHFQPRRTEHHPMHNFLALLQTDDDLRQQYEASIGRTTLKSYEPYTAHPVLSGE